MKKLIVLLTCLLLTLVLAACDGPQGEKGEKGDKGDKGDTPTISISDDGYWVINGEKTNVKAEADAAGDSANPQGLAFYLKDDGTYAVAIGNARYLSEIVIPATYCGRAVTEIAAFGFSGSITGEMLPLKKITIPDSVTYIGGGAFEACASLTEVYISDIESWCNIDFSYEDSNPLWCAANLYLDGELVTELVIPDGIEKVKDYAFYGYSSLTSVTIPDSVTSIGDNAFLYCDSLNTVYYKGTAAEWSNIVIDDYGNSDLTFATRYYYSETEPTTSGNFWHYNDEGEIVKW